jgi:hypothetical protein
VLILAQLNPRNITNGAIIDISIALSAWNKKEFHHIHPRAFLESINSAGEYNAIGNICMLTSSENKIVSDSDPKQYLSTCAQALGVQADQVFKSNLLPLPQQLDYSNTDYQTFLKVRSKLIGEMARNLCTGQIQN